MSQFFASKSNAGGDYRRQLLFGFDALALAASSSASDPQPLREARCVGPKTTWVLPLPTPEQARAHLARLVRLARAARCLPWPYWPRTAGVALAKAERTEGLALEARFRALTAQNPAEILEAALSHWGSDHEEHSGGADAHLPATRALFRGCDHPFVIHTDPWPEWLPCPGSPLAWRLMVEMESWRDALNLTTA